MNIVCLSDSPTPSGFGRISNEVFKRLAMKGHQIHVVSLLWDGIYADDKLGWYHPSKHKYPFQISGAGGRDIFQYTANVISLANPEIVMVIQDFPYAENLYFNMRIDWSRRAFIIITPIDGEPIREQWLLAADESDGTMVISEFGVEAMRKAGRRVTLCPPGIDVKEFYPAVPEEKLTLREKAGIPKDAFLLGMMAMNQGRKDIPHTLDGFWEFAKDKPNAYLFLDMDKAGPAGWDIPKDLMKPKGIPEDRVLFKEQLVAKGLKDLRDRYVILDAHSVLSHREGFGLPLIESQACRIPSIAMAWCSGPEICGNGKGYLVRPLRQSKNSTWGGANDKDPYVPDFIKILNKIYDNPIEAAGVADKGYQYAISRTWDNATHAVEQVLNEARAKLDARSK